MSSSLVLLRHDITAAQNWITDKQVKLRHRVITAKNVLAEFEQRNDDIQNIINDTKTYLTHHRNQDPVLQLNVNKLIKAWQQLSESLDGSRVTVAPLNLSFDDNDSVSSLSSEALYTPRFDSSGSPEPSRRFITHLTPLYRAVIKAKVSHHKRSVGSSSMSSISVSPSGSIYASSPLASPGRSLISETIKTTSTRMTTNTRGVEDLSLDLSDSESELEPFPWVEVSDDELDIPDWNDSLLLTGGTKNYRRGGREDDSSLEEQSINPSENTGDTRAIPFREYSTATSHSHYRSPKESPANRVDHQQLNTHQQLQSPDASTENHRSRIVNNSRSLPSQQPIIAEATYFSDSEDKATLPIFPVKLACDLTKNDSSDNNNAYHISSEARSDPKDYERKSAEQQIPKFSAMMESQVPPLLYSSEGHEPQLEDGTSSRIPPHDEDESVSPFSHLTHLSSANAKDVHLDQPEPLTISGTPDVSEDFQNHSNLEEKSVLDSLDGTLRQDMQEEEHHVKRDEKANEDEDPCSKNSVGDSQFDSTNGQLPSPSITAESSFYRSNSPNDNGDAFEFPRKRIGTQMKSASLPEASDQFKFQIEPKGPSVQTQTSEIETSGKTSWWKLLLIATLLSLILFLIAIVIVSLGCDEKNHCYHCGIFGLRKQYTTVPPH